MEVLIKPHRSGSAYYAPGAAVAEMVGAILGDKHKVLPCAAYLDGEYGVHGIFMGVPCKLGESGIEQILEIKLTKQEQAEFDKSVNAVQALVAVIDGQLIGALASQVA